VAAPRKLVRDAGETQLQIPLCAAEDQKAAVSLGMTRVCSEGETALLREPASLSHSQEWPCHAGWYPALGMTKSPLCRLRSLAGTGGGFESFEKFGGEAVETSVGHDEDDVTGLRLR
jgi:hypothetical protein